jgi:hypothetical protein
MTKLQFALLSFAAIIGGGILYKFVPDLGPTVAAPLAGLGILGLGFVLRSPWDKAAIAEAQNPAQPPATATELRPKDGTP